MGVGAVIAGAVGAVGKMVKGRQESQVAARNESRAIEEARIAEESSEYQASQHDTQVRKLLAGQKTQMAASGMDVGLEEGSAMAMMSDTAREAAIEREQIIKGGKYASEAKMWEAGSYQMQGKHAKTAGLLGAAGSLVSGFAGGYDAGLFSGGGGAATVVDAGSSKTYGIVN